MKKLTLLLVILLTSFLTYAQTYVITNVSGALKITNSNGVILATTNPVTVTSPYIDPSNLVINIRNQDFNITIPSANITNVGGSAPAGTQAGLVSQIAALSPNALSITTNSTSGAATFLNGILNIPNYTVLTYPNTIKTYINGYGVWVGLNTDSLIEGAVNQFYTTARANLKLDKSDSTIANRVTVNQTAIQNNRTIALADSVLMTTTYAILNSAPTFSGDLSTTAIGANHSNNYAVGSFYNSSATFVSPGTTTMGVESQGVTGGNGAFVSKLGSTVTGWQRYDGSKWSNSPDTVSALQTKSLATNVVSSGTNYAILATDHTIRLTATTLTATLPTAVGVIGKIYSIKLTVAGTGTVATTSSQTIDGATTYSLSAVNKYIMVQSDGANWMIIANN